MSKKYKTSPRSLSLENAATGERDTNRYSGDRGRPSAHDRDSSLHLTRKGRLTATIAGLAVVSAIGVGVANRYEHAHDVVSHANHNGEMLNSDNQPVDNQQEQAKLGEERQQNELNQQEAAQTEQK